MAEYLDNVIEQMGWATDQDFCDWLFCQVAGGFDVVHADPSLLPAAFAGSR